MRKIEKLYQLIVREVVGDKSVARGIHYQTAWTTLKIIQSKGAVVLYAGNDVLHTTKAPATPSNGTGSPSLNKLLDEWVQLKSGHRQWTLNRILADSSLMRNFVVNALISESLGRSWRVGLVSEGYVAVNEIRRLFPESDSRSEEPTKNRQRAISRQRVLQRASQLWEEIDGEKLGISSGQIELIVWQVLGYLAESVPTTLSEIEARLDQELTLRFMTEDRIKAVRGLIYEHVATFAARTLDGQVSIDLSLLEQECGIDLTSHARLVRHPEQAFNEQVDRGTREHPSGTFVRRSSFERSLSQFLKSDKTLYILDSETGEGKSSVLADYARRLLKDRPRLVMNASRLLEGSSLQDVVGREFKQDSFPGEDVARVCSRVLAVCRSVHRPLIVFGDELSVLPDAAGVANRLEQVCGEAAAAGIKLVIAARSPVWRRIAERSRLSPYLFRPIASPGSGVNQDFSLRLGPLTDGELHEFLARRFDPVEAARLLAILRLPAYSVLKNAQLLTIFLEDLGELPLETTSLQPVGVDDLLRLDLRRRAVKALEAAGLEVDEVEEVLDALAKLFWPDRHQGKKAGGFAKGLTAAVGSLGRPLFQHLQINGVLSRDNSLRSPEPANIAFSMPRSGERLLADWLLRQPPEDFQRLICELQPGLDDGILEAVVRTIGASQISDVVEWADALLAREPRWLPALCQGLSERQLEDPGVPAFLIACANDHGSFSVQDALRPLGQMLGRSPIAMQRVRSLYLDTPGKSSFNGEQSLGWGLDVNPDFVCSLIRERLGRDLPKEQYSWHDEAKRARLVSRALSPLIHVGTEYSARLAKSTLDWMEEAFPSDKRTERQDVTKSYNTEFQQARGAALARLSDGEFAELLNDLKSASPVVQDNAAKALRNVVIDQPGRRGLRAAVLEAIGRKNASYSTQDLGYVYAAAGDLGIGRAIKRSGLIKTWGSAIALSELGLLAKYDSELAASTLPPQPIWDHWTNQMLAEPLAVAWARTGQAGEVEKAILALLKLEQPSLAPVNAEWFCFGIRGSALATLGRILLDFPDSAADFRSAPTSTHYMADETNEGFVYVDLEEFCVTWGPRIRGHVLFPQYVAQLLSAIRVATDWEVHPVQRLLSERQFRCMNLCADELCAVLPYCEDPIKILGELPRDWPAIRGCLSLLKVGVQSAQAVELGLAICREQKAIAIGNVVRDRDAFLAELEKRDLISSESRIRDFGRSAANRLHGIGRDGLGNLLSDIEASMEKWKPVEFLEKWTDGATEWRSVLLAHVFRECLTQGPFSRAEVRDLCVQAIRALRSLHNTEEARLQLDLFEALEALLSQRGDIPLAKRLESNGLLAKSLNCAWSILSEYRSGGDVSLAALKRMLEQQGGYVVSHHEEMKRDGLYTTSRIGGTVVVPPALRLALAAVTHMDRNVDEFGSSLALRSAAYSAIHEEPFSSLNWVHRYPEDHRAEVLDRMDKALPSLLARFSDEPAVWSTKASVKLLQGRAQEAIESTEVGLALPILDKLSKASLLYDKACGHAILMQQAEARESLAEALGLNPSFREFAREDSDFDGVKSEKWFWELVNPPRINSA